MNIAVQGYYRPGSRVREAIRVARHLTTVGHDVVFRTTGPRPAREVCPDLDRRVLDALKPQALSVWYERFDAVLWFDSPEPYLVEAAHTVGAAAILAAPLDSLIRHHKGSYGRAAAVVCPHRYAAEILADNWKVGQVVHIPSSPETFQFLKTARRLDRPPNLVVVLDGRWPDQFSPSLFSTLETLVEDRPGLSLDVLYLRRAVSGLGRKTLTGMRRAYPDRVFLRDLRSVPESEILLSYLRADLVVCPALWDSWAQAAITALGLGTPVMAYDVDPFSEVIKDHINGRLVACDLEYDWIGGPRARPADAEFAGVLRDSIDSPASLVDLAVRAAAFRADRRQAFTRGWNSLLPPSGLDKM